MIDDEIPSLCQMINRSYSGNLLPLSYHFAIFFQNEYVEMVGINLKHYILCERLDMIPNIDQVRLMIVSCKAVLTCSLPPPSFNVFFFQVDC